MKKTLVEVPEAHTGCCEGCVFQLSGDPCFSVICRRLLIKEKDCVGKIYLLEESNQKSPTKKKSTSKSKSNKKVKSTKSKK